MHQHYTGLDLQTKFTSSPLPQVKPGDEHMRGKKELAARLVGDAACLALDLVQYDPSVDRAMRYAFGRTFICKARPHSRAAAAAALPCSAEPAPGL